MRKERTSTRASVRTLCVYRHPTRSRANTHPPGGDDDEKPGLRERERDIIFVGDFIFCLFVGAVRRRNPTRGGDR